MRPASWILAAFGIAALGACTRTEPPPFRPVADVKEIMRSIVDPAAGDVWGAAGWITTREGTIERGPTTSVEWTEIRKQAVTLTDRIDYLCPLTNNLCYCLAVENCSASRSRRRRNGCG